MIASTSLEIDGSKLSLADVAQVANQSGVCLFASAEVIPRMGVSAKIVERAVQANDIVYGVTTGFGGMAGVAVDGRHAAASQENLLSFLAAAAGDEIDRRHVRGAMLLRANVLAQGYSGVRYEIVERLLSFLSEDATPIVRELGSIGASGDLVPLSAIGRAITGANDFVEVRIGERLLSGHEALVELGLEPLSLRPKEGLAIVNGTSFSSAIAANATNEVRHLMAITFTVQAMLLQALQAQEEPFNAFVQEQKPHPGQRWSAQIIRRLLQEGRTHVNGKPPHVQDRYSLRCLPQYMGSIVEGITRVTSVVETEMNSVSDNPLVDVANECFYQSGNFLGQYLAVAMDDLRRFIGLMAKHLDVQIATLVAPEFSNGLPASLRGNDAVPYNMGLKGLQITGNSIMPLLTWHGNPIVEHFPTHAEQFNQNINGLSWGSANLAWKSVGLFRHYLAVAAIFAVQALDLRARSSLNHCDGRAIIGSHLVPFYESVCRAIRVEIADQRPLLFNDTGLWLEQALTRISEDIEQHGDVVRTVQPVVESFDEEFK